MGKTTSKDFAVLCFKDFPRKTVEKLLSTANDAVASGSSPQSKLRLIETEPELAQEYRPDPAETVFKFRRPRHGPDPINDTEDIDHRWGVALDEQTSKDNTSCRIRDATPENTRVSTVRVDLRVALGALQALAQGDATVLQLRNRSMTQGGILTVLNDSQATEHQSEELKSIRDLRQSKTPPSDDQFDGDKILPIFLTANIEDELLSEFVTVFNKDYDNLQWMFVSSTSVEELMERHSHGEGHTNASTPFKGAFIDDVVNFQQNNFPGWDIMADMFLVLDEHTSKGRGVIMGQNSEHSSVQGLQLVRVPFKTAKLCATSTSISEPPIEESVDEAVEESDGLVPESNY